MTFSHPVQQRRSIFILAFLVGLLAFWFDPVVRADDADADRAFTAAVKLFQGGWHDLAEKDLGAFQERFPTSTNRVQAALLQAQCRFQLKDYSGAIKLIESRLSGAGAWNDQYRYWLGQAQLQQDRFEAAANTYADLLKECPDSPLRLEASYSEAFARLKLGDTARTVELLRTPAGAFQSAAKGSTNETVLVRGSFLLAEALFAQKNFPVAQQTLAELAQRGLSPEAEWQRQYLLTRIEMTDRHSEAALMRVTNLVALAASRSNALLQARSLTLKGEILEEKQPVATVEAYEDITRIPGVSSDQKRQALLKLVDLAVVQNHLTNAIEQLDAFLKQNTEDPASDLIRFTLGEVYLKQFYAFANGNGNAGTAGPNTRTNLSASTNLLFLARTQFDSLLTQFTNSVYRGKAYLNRGWSYWEEAQLLGDPSKLVEGQKAFVRATAELPAKSVDQAQARFKLADCLFGLKDYTNALTSYHLVCDQYADVPEVKEKLLDHALYQILRASIDSGNLSGAQAALQQLLAQFPNSAWSDHALFIYGQSLMEAGEFVKAQEALADLQKRFPNSSLVPEVRLAVARSYARQSDRATAIQAYAEWLTHFTNHVARPQAEFDRAWCFYQSGKETNALVLFTNLVQQFPASASTPLAQMWIGDYYLNQQDYAEAETWYQQLFRGTNTAPADLARQATLMAAKAAFFRQGYNDARKYLEDLINDPQVGPEAWFMLGDIELEGTNKLAKFSQAIVRFQRVTKFAGSPLVPLAMGKIGDCNLQLAVQSTNRYEAATNQYWQVMNHPLADVPTRSQAEVGLGLALEKMAEHWTNRTELLTAALAHYLNVANASNVDREKEEEPDPFWMKTAALAAGNLAVDRLQRFDEAERLYQSMLKTLPSLAPTWEKQLKTLRQQRTK